MTGKKQKKLSNVVYGQVVEGHLAFLDVNRLHLSDYEKRAKLPEKLVRKYGDSPMSVRMFYMEAKYEEQILNGLEKAGYKCTRDDALVLKALGWGKPKGELVYAEGMWHDPDNPHLIFLEEKRAMHCAYLNKVVRAAKSSGITWGEFKEREPIAYNAIFEPLEPTLFDDWLEETASSPDKALRDLKNDPERAREAFCKEFPLPERLPFNGETYAIGGALGDSVEFMLTFGCEGNMFAAIPEDIVARYGYVDETRWGDEFLILKSQYRKEIIDALERYGYKCEENGDLISWAVGWE